MSCPKLNYTYDEDLIPQALYNHTRQFTWAPKGCSLTLDEAENVISYYDAWKALSSGIVANVELLEDKKKTITQRYISVTVTDPSTFISVFEDSKKTKLLCTIPLDGFMEAEYSSLTGSIVLENYVSKALGLYFNDSINFKIVLINVWEAINSIELLNYYRIQENNSK